MKVNPQVYSSLCISSIQSHLEKSGTKYITYPKFIFLCGKGIDPQVSGSYENSNRGIIHKYINKLLPNTKIVLSEQLWEDSFNDSIDLLTFEEFLAEISDAIILFVESPGSFCELGAFAYADGLFSDKLIIIIDEKYQRDQSFIATGPVLKARKNGSKVIYAQIEDSALLASHELRIQILSLVKTFNAKRDKVNKRTINDCGNRVYISSFIVELLEILKIVEPISKSDLLQVYKLIKNFESFKLVKRDGSDFNREIKFGYILKLLQSADIISFIGDNIILNDYKNPQSLMLKYHGNAMDKERNRIICRKYRYGEPV